MKRAPRPVTAQSLQRAATSYVERYPGSADKLRRILQRRVARARSREAPVMDDVEQAIDAIVGKFVAAGVVDDRSFAATRARSLHRRGTSDRLTRHKLKLAGVDEDITAQALADLDRELDSDPAQREWRAALALARRRRLGPFRPAAERADRRLRDLAALARAGFDYQLAKKVIDSEEIA